MIVIAEQAALARVAARAASVAIKGGTIPILQNVLIDARDGQVSLTATDLDMEIRERFAATVDRPGQITVNAASLSEIARNAPNGSEVMIQWENATDPRALVKFGRSKYRLPVLPAGDFPIRDGLKDATEMTMPAADLLTLLDHVHFAQSSEETRYYLCGTYFHTLADEGQAVFRVVATDGHRMVLDQRPVDTGTSIPGVIVPRAAVAEFRRLLAGSKADAKVSATTTGVSLEIGDTRLITKTIDGAYPDYERVRPRQWDREILIDRAVLHGAVKRVALISADKARSVKLTIDDEVLTLTVRNMEAGMADEEIEVSGDGEHFETGFNAKYLLDVLEQTDADQMVFRVTDGMSPARLDPHPGTKGAECIVNVIMPLRV
ncbi:MAG: DNA polymerase III subunit beta [Brevundimonas sp.]|nr:MAG: DNA polymerase III subunit beta [Brevundimonas sp.]